MHPTQLFLRYFIILSMRNFILMVLILKFFIFSLFWKMKSLNFFFFFFFFGRAAPQKRKSIKHVPLPEALSRQKLACFSWCYFVMERWRQSCGMAPSGLYPALGPAVAMRACRRHRNMLWDLPRQNHPAGGIATCCGTCLDKTILQEASQHAVGLA